MDSDEHGAVSVGSPLQAALVGSEQALPLILFPHEQEGSHPDHWPHSAQTPATVEVIHLKTNQKNNPKPFVRVPGHSDILQSPASVEFPGQC